MRQLIRTVWLLSLMLLMTACTNQAEVNKQMLDRDYQATQRAIHTLTQQLASGQVGNVLMLKQYAQVARSESPDLTAVIDLLALDVNRDGPLISSMGHRLAAVEARLASVALKSQHSIEFKELSAEMSSLRKAANVRNFNMALTDPINVLADLTKGRLPRVGDQAQQAQKDQSQAGSQLVGNPNYGQWSSNSSGGSFWEWYGKYALLSSLFNRPYSYDRWYNRSPSSYSYYRRQGRHTYTSPQQYRRIDRFERKTQKKFARQGKTFNSPYARKAQSSNGFNKANKFGSNKPSSSSYGARSPGGSSSKSSSSSSRFKSAYSSKNSGFRRSFGGGGK